MFVINPVYLLKEMCVYELTVRNRAPPEGTNANEVRNLLRVLNARHLAPEPQCIQQLDFESEIETCGNILDAIQQKIVDFKNDDSNGGSLQIKARLQHLLNRYSNLILITKVDEVEKLKQLEDYSSLVRQILRDFEVYLDGHPDATVVRAEPTLDEAIGGVPSGVSVASSVGLSVTSSIESTQRTHSISSRLYDSLIADSLYRHPSSTRFGVSSSISTPRVSSTVLSNHPVSWPLVTGNPTVSVIPATPTSNVGPALGAPPISTSSAVDLLLSPNYLNYFPNVNQPSQWENNRLYTLPQTLALPANQFPSALPVNQFASALPANQFASALPANQFSSSFHPNQFSSGPVASSNAPLAHQSLPSAQPEVSFNQSSFCVPSVFEKYAQKTALDLVLKELKVTDGTEPHALLKVLRKMLDLHSLPGMSDCILYSIMFPYTKGGLKYCLKTAIKEKFSFGLFHSFVLNSLIPPQLKDQLKIQYYSRYQKANESFATFVSEIKLANKLLKLNYSQHEVIQTIVHYCAPEDRARFVFAEEPRTYYELQLLCEKVQSFKFAESARQTGLAPSSGAQGEQSSGNPSAPNDRKFRPQGQSNQKVPFYQPKYPPPKSGNAAFVASSEQKPQFERKCYRCGDSSHLIRNCPHPKNESAQ
ncbi:unnamed protein product [Bemisia tabaci]|uniref:CCHC-type domain-containing protein n=1 Tax=Bemisia tabaci TaxID=7038 RepID=A0A9N9ZZZ4_BEMTA|nr:unnamed protein product [Bemisia tabaci]